jgi:hypothetical protein
MTNELGQRTIASIEAENQRLRSLIERLHDHFSPADCEQFPQHDNEICHAAPKGENCTLTTVAAARGCSRVCSTVL